MHPAKSIILFTTLSGLGFGLMAVLGLGLPPVRGLSALIFTLLAVGLAGIGLLASLFHLGNPQRFIKALTQVRSSWLSREGVLAILTMGCFTIYGGLLYFEIHLEWLGYFVTFLALVTVLSTAMIYAQMRTVPRWFSPLTPALFLAYALTGGLLLGAQLKAAMVASVVLFGIQIAHWARGRQALTASGSTPESATGLGAMGRVRLLESPHTARNYVTSEMAYKLARQRAGLLKLMVMGMMVLQVLGMVFLPSGHLASIGYIALHVAATLVARWLFFAESEHVVSLYYRK